MNNIEYNKTMPTTAMMRSHNRMLSRTLTLFCEAIGILSKERYPAVGLKFPIIRRVRDVLLLLLQQEQQQQEQHEEEEEKNMDQEMMIPITKKIDLKQGHNNNITTT